MLKTVNGIVRRIKVNGVTIALTEEGMKAIKQGKNPMGGNK